MKSLDNTPQKKSGNYKNFGKLVGRTREIEQLYSSIQNARQGHGGFVLLNGEAGIGKSTLAKHLSEWVVSSGFSTWNIYFDKSNVYNPYKPFLDLVAEFKSGNRALESQDTVKNDINPQSEIAHANHNKEAENLFNLQNKQGIIQQSLISDILKQSNQTPMLILLNDLHYSSQTAWQFLHYLSEKIRESRIVLLGTVRQDGNEKAENKKPVYADVIQRMNREGLVTKIQLNRLSREDVRLYLSRRYAKSDFSSNFTTIMFEVSNGLPERFVSYTDILQEQKIIFKREGIWYNEFNLTKEKIAKILNDKSKAKSKSDIFAGLNPDQIQLLQYAALLDSRIGYQMMAKLVNKPKIPVLKNLIYLADQKYLLDQNHDTFTFRYDSLIVQIRNKIASEKKEEMLQNLVEILPKVKGLDEKEKIYQLANLYQQTKNSDKTFRYLLLAGNAALHALAFEEARNFYQKSLTLINAVAKEVQKRHVIFLHIRLAWVERILGLWEESLLNCKKAKKLAENEKSNLFKNIILLQEGLTQFRLRNWKKSLVCFSTCLAEKLHLSTFNEVMCLYGMGSVYYEMGDHTRSIRYFDMALKLSNTMERPSMLAKLLNNLGAVESIRGNHMRAVKYYSDSIPLYEKSGDNYGMAQVYNNLGLTYAEGEKWQEANESYGKALQYSDYVGIIPLKTIIFLNRVFALIQLDQLDEAVEYNKKAFNLLKHSKDDLNLAEYYKNLGIIHRQKNQHDKAIDKLEQARKKFKSLNNILGSAECEYELALIASALNNKNDIDAWLNKATASFKQLGLKGKIKKIDKIRQELLPMYNVSA